MNVAIQASQELSTIIVQSLTAFNQISEVAWNHKPLPSKWSKKELLGHLIDSASNNLRRFVVGQYEQGVKIGYQQDEWVAIQDYQAANIEDLKLLWKLMNEQIIRVLKKIPGDRLQNISVREQEYTLAYYIEDYLVHLNYHLAQINDSNRPL
jgi:hypothetical protein